jgi:hypothetical protein
MKRWHRWLYVLLAVHGGVVAQAATDLAARDDAPDAARGLELLLNRAYVESAFDQEAFDEAWRGWEEPARSRAAAASAGERRDMAYARYGLIERPGDPQHRPLQFVVDDQGQWTINCLACHQGHVAGKVVWGVPNAQFAMETLVSEVRAAKLRLGKPLSSLDRGSLVVPLGSTVGTTNAVAFGVALLHYRDKDLIIHADRPPPALVHHDHDAPAWWNTSRKARLYCDNFAPRGHRALMQFLAGRENGPEKFRQWETDFRHVEAYIESLQPPAYPFPIDRELARRGKTVFAASCAECHGTYGDSREGDDYPERIIPLEEIGTDPVRLRAITPEHRIGWGQNWINRYGAQGDVIADPGGYLAPPLRGIWASAPYFHNGSVPTLWHVLHPEQRPLVWRHPDAGASGSQYDFDRVGLDVETLAEWPSPRPGAAQRRRYFDTRRFGKSSAGHDFPSELTAAQRDEVLEYLKTL